MTSTPHYAFGTFRLDPDAACLWRGDELVPLPPKPFALLAYLVTHAGEVVSKDELLDAVWPETAVSKGVLKTHIGRLRQVLGERAQQPQYLATVHRRGYRFIAPVTVEPPPSAELAVALLPHATHVPSHLSPYPMVGREAELAQLHQLWLQALQGQRQLVFVAGEAGIGKSTLVDAFVAHVTDPVWVGRGQCIEQYGSGEAYLPLLEVLGVLSREPDHHRLVSLLQQQAPSWLLQMPGLVSATEYDALRQRSNGVTRDRMLRELAEAIEILTAEHPLVLVLEDLHWSDVATLDWLTFIAHRRVTAQLMVVGTYRPADAAMRAHPVHAVSQKLHRQGQATELLLPYLSQTGVAAYIEQRFGVAQCPERLVRVLHQRTSGNPFFLVTVVEELVRQGLLGVPEIAARLQGDLQAVAAEIPQSIRQLIDLQFANLSRAEQEALAVASVVGNEFSAAAAAACLDLAIDDVEAQYDTLVRRGQFVCSQGVSEWPDGTVATRYEFIHDLYNEILYDRVPTSRRMRWHRQIGMRLEAGYGTRVREVAVELATHFVRGREASRAVHYLQVAGEQALRRSANVEAIAHLTKGLELLATLPDSSERLQIELVLQTTLGPALMATRGFTTPEVEQTYDRTRVLCDRIEESPQLLPVLWSLWRYYGNRGALQTEREMSERILALSQRLNDPTFLPVGHTAVGGTLYPMGAFVLARQHLEHGIKLSTFEQDRLLTLRYGLSAAVQSLNMMAHVLWALGYPDQAFQRTQEALTLAQALGHPLSLSYAQAYAGRLHRLRGEVHRVHQLADTAVTYAIDHGFRLQSALGMILRGWALVRQGQDTAGMAQIRQGCTEALAMGGVLIRVTRLPILAEVCGDRGRVDEALGLLDEALVVSYEAGYRNMEAETYCLKGEVLLKPSIPDEQQAEACFHQALEISRQQQAKSWELRAATSLARLWKSQGKRQGAYDLLAPVYGWFTEGFGTADLKEAKVLLAELTR